MTVGDLTARIRRLEQLSQGLCKEVRLWKRREDLLEFGERKTYLTAIQDAIAGTDQAWVVLARARQRIEDQAKKLAEQQNDERQL